MTVKNRLLIGATRFFSSQNNSIHDPNRPRILIVSTTGLGDSLWGTPAVRAIKTRFPDSKLTLLTSPIGEQLFRHSPHIDETFVIKDPAFTSAIKLLPKLRRKRFEIALIFHLSQRPILPLVALCNPSQIIGTEGMNKGLDSLLTQALNPTYQHEIERRLDLVAAIGVAKDGPEMELYLTEEEKQTAETFLSAKKHSFLVGIHPGAKDRFKQWNPKHFIALGKRLQKEKDAQIFITGNHAEHSLAEALAKEIPGACSIAGKFSVRATAALIERLHLFLTNDTGPMHIAYAMKTPTFSLFAPTDAHLCGPYEVSHAAWIQKKPTCAPCLRKQCLEPFCLEQISEEDAWKQINKLVK